MKGKSLGRMKGFVFTLLALLIIAFMIIEISIYFSAYQVRQESEPMKIRTRVIEEFATQLSPPNMNRVSYVAAYNAIYHLTQDAVARPVQTYGTADNISASISTLMWNGTRNDTGKLLIIGGTLESWEKNIEALANKEGMSLDVNCTDFVANQTDPWTVQVTYTFAYVLHDDYTNTNISDVYNVSVAVSIVGFEDPLFRNKTGQVRNIFPSPSDVKARKIFDTNHDAVGKGWVYGEVYRNRILSDLNEFREEDFDTENKKKILFTSNYHLAVDYGNMFGGVIYYGPDYLTVGPLLSVPFLALGSAHPMPGLPPAVLIKSGSDSDITTANFSIYDIEGLRAFATCGYYTTSPAAPSFFDRLSSQRNDNTVRLMPSDFGIETSVVGLGSWVIPGRSAVDYEYYQGTSGHKVMGMTGCKNREMCADNLLPKFRISTAHIATYGLSDLACTERQNVGRCG